MFEYIEIGIVRFKCDVFFNKPKAGKNIKTFLKKNISKEAQNIWNKNYAKAFGVNQKLKINVTIINVKYAPLFSIHKSGPLHICARARVHVCVCVNLDQAAPKATKQKAFAFFDLRALKCYRASLQAENENQKSVFNDVE